MSTVSKDDGRVDKAWRCDCGDGHFLSVTYWKADPRLGFDVSGQITLEGAFGARMKQRAKLIWQLLRNTGHMETWVGVALTAENAREISGVLGDYVREWDDYQKGLEGK